MTLKLTHAERIILSNQFQMLAKLDPTNAASYEDSKDIVDSGYELLYGDISSSVFEETVPYEVCQEVESILSMFRNIEFSARNIGVKPADLDAEFEGFDGNHDHGYFGYSQYIRTRPGRWDELKKYPHNSHTQTSLPRYRIMLARYKALGKHMDLTDAEIRAIAKH